MIMSSLAVVDNQKVFWIDTELITDCLFLVYFMFFHHCILECPLKKMAILYRLWWGKNYIVMLGGKV